MTLTSGELSDMRSHAGTILLTQTGVIWQATETTDSIGDRVESWAPSGTVSCYIAATPRSGINPGDGRIVFGMSWTGYVAYDTTINVGNRLVVTIDSTDRSFGVAGINDAIAWPILKRLQLEERQ